MLLAYEKAFNTTNEKILRLRRKSYGNFYKILAGSYFSAGNYRMFLREVLTDNENGLLFNSNEPDDLAAAMIKLYRQPELRERLGRQALQDAERRFHIRIIAAEWEDYYRNIISENKSK